jgi:8-hydroxy-5-deazaflavin:NADPH oxidoreductase
VSRSIAILGGTGPEGLGLARRWAKAGETIIIGSRDAARASGAATKLKEILGNSAQISGVENSAAAGAAEIIVLTVPFEGHAALLKQIKPVIRPGAIVIDTAVPLATSVGGRATRTLGIWEGSVAQQTAELVPKGVSVVAAFHNASAESLNSDGPVECDILTCSDQPAATETVLDLAAKIPGVRGIDAGKLESARIIEQITALLIALNIKHKGHSGIRITGLPASAYRG